MSSDNGILKPPQGFDHLLELLAREVLRKQPANITSFAAQLFTDRLKERYEQSTKQAMSDTLPSGENVTAKFPIGEMNVTAESPIGEKDVAATVSGVANNDDEPTVSVTPNMASFESPPRPRRGRRVSVSAESMNPDQMAKMEKVIHPKADEVKTRILSMVQNNFLFNNLDDEQLDEVVLAMFEKTTTPGEEVIKQGDDGDYFYVVESGTFDIFVTPYGEETANVGTIEPKGSFGELALMYNAPRAATIKCTNDAVLWAMDRMTFRRILMDTTSKKRRMYESFLSSIEILKSIEPYERVKIADGLESQDFTDGEDVIKQGEVGDRFYLVEKGELVAIVDDLEVAKLKKGDYFGELALLFSQPRKATVRACGDVTVAYLGVEAFNRMLGPCSDIMRRGMSHYDEKVAAAKERSHA